MKVLSTEKRGLCQIPRRRTQHKKNEKIGIVICLGGFATINQILRFDRLNEWGEYKVKDECNLFFFVLWNNPKSVLTPNNQLV